MSVERRHPFAVRVKCLFCSSLSCTGSDDVNIRIIAQTLLFQHQRPKARLLKVNVSSQSDCEASLLYYNEGDAVRQPPNFALMKTIKGDSFTKHFGAPETTVIFVVR